MESEKKQLDHKPRRGVLIAFKNVRPNPNLRQLNKFERGLEGYIDHSNHNKYRYNRGGLLNEVPHIKLKETRSILIVNKEDAGKIISFMEEYGTEVYVKEIELDEKDVLAVKTFSEETLDEPVEKPVKAGGSGGKKRKGK